MGRVHLFELQDQSWFPALLGDAGTAYLRALARLAKVHELLTPVVAEALDRSGRNRIVDLCSGAGGPAVSIAESLRNDGRDVALTLSDLRPNQWALDDLAAQGATVHPARVDAASVPSSLVGLRTIFNAFHHFEDAQALAVLRDAVSAGEPIAIVELSERSVASVLGSLLIPLFVLLMMPAVRPARALWLVLTYLIPILPLTIAWDGLVSHLRTRSPAELGALVARVDAPGWTWRTERRRGSGGVGYTLLLGLPPEPTPS